MPSSELNKTLDAAKLGTRKVQFFQDDSAIQVDEKLREVLPKLEGAGGYMLKGNGTHHIFPIEPPYRVSRLKKEIGHGKVFIKPLQNNLELTTEAVSEDEEVGLFVIL